MYLLQALSLCLLKLILIKYSKFDKTDNQISNQHLILIYQSDLFQQMLEQQQEDKEGVDAVEHYLRTLRKKVEHQVRNPFDLTFANFTFDELATWKNNVLQLDATSRLYGQRVDFLHCGAMQILGSVLNSQVAVQGTTEQKAEIRKEQVHDNSPFERHLEQPAKLNCTIQRMEINSVLWRQICKKRDALHQLMLNQLPVDSDICLILNASQTLSINTRYENIINQFEPSIYLKLLDFNSLSLKFMNIFREMEQAASEANLFMVNYSGEQKVRGDNVKLQSWMQFDFQCLQQPIEYAFGLQRQEGIQHPQASPLLEINMEVQADSQETSSEFSDFANSQDYFQLEDWEQGSKKAKPKKKVKEGRESHQKRDAQMRARLKEMVDFKGMYLQRSLIFLPEQENFQQKFLNSRDFLLLRFIKYNHPVAKKPKKTVPSKFKPLPDHAITNFTDMQVNQVTAFEPVPTELPNNDSFGSWNPLNSRFSQQKRFKEAALPIKQMKRRIREKLVLDKNNRISFQQIRQNFSNDQPLDIFISVLHIAAQEQALISV